MIHFRKEYSKLHNGFSFYRPSDPYSAGFVFRWKSVVYYFRYVKAVKKFTFRKQTLGQKQTDGVDTTWI